MRVAPAIELSCEARLELERLSRRRTTPVRVAQRSRFRELGVAGLMKDAPRPGRTPAILPERVAEVIARTTQSNPDGATHWSRSRMAREMGISDSSVGRIWRAHGLKPHRVETHRSF